MSMDDVQNTPDRIAELLVHVGRATRSEDGRSELTAAQWTCLRFFARANGNTRTPSSFASFQATTRGTASQIIKTLENKGLIVRRRSETDGRSVCFDLTDVGQKTLEKDPLCDLMGVIESLGQRESDRFLDTLSRLATALADLREVPSFGTCGDCSHYSSDGGVSYCACISAQLATDEIDRLCASYRKPDTDTHAEGQRDEQA